MGDVAGNKRQVSTGWIAGVALLTLAGLALRGARLGDRDFWFDESCTHYYVVNLFDWPEGSSLLAESTNLPYYVLLKGWAALFGQGEAAYRSFSVIAATLVIPVLALVTRRLTDRRIGLVCAALVAFHPLHIYYAREARAYALWTLTLSLMLWALVAAVRDRRARWWVLYGLLLLFSLHLHYFTLFWVPVSVMAVALAADRRSALRRFLVTTAIAGLAFVPYVFLAVLPAARQGGVSWIAPSFEAWQSLPKSLWVFLSAAAYPVHLRGLSLVSADTVSLLPPVINRIAATIPLLIIAVLALVVWRSYRSRVEPIGGYGASDRACRLEGAATVHKVLLLLSIGPLVLALVYSLAVAPTYLVGRYDLIGWPAFVVWQAVVIGQGSRLVAVRRSSLAMSVIIVALAACSLVPIGRMLTPPSGPTFHRARAERVASLTDAGDLVVTLSYDRYHLVYYLDRAGFRGEIATFPSWLADQVGWVDRSADSDPQRIGVSEADARMLVERVQATLARGDRAYMLVDSMGMLGDDPRRAINVRFIEACRAAGIDGRVVDAELGIFQLEMSAAQE